MEEQKSLQSIPKIYDRDHIEQCKLQVIDHLKLEIANVNHVSSTSFSTIFHDEDDEYNMTFVPYFQPSSSLSLPSPVSKMENKVGTYEAKSKSRISLKKGFRWIKQKILYGYIWLVVLHRISTCMYVVVRAWHWNFRNLWRILAVIMWSRVYGPSRDR